MKRFILFAGDDYYPRGGAKDFIGWFDTIEQATEHVAKRGHWDWANVLDTKHDETQDIKP